MGISLAKEMWSESLCSVRDYFNSNILMFTKKKKDGLSPTFLHKRKAPYGLATFYKTAQPEALSLLPANRFVSVGVFTLALFPHSQHVSLQKSSATVWQLLKQEACVVQPLQQRQQLAK